MLPRCIACLGKDTLIGFINHLYLDKYICIPVIYENCFDKIFCFYGKDFVCSRHRSNNCVNAVRIFCYDYRNCFKGKDFVCSRHWKNYTFTEIFRVFCLCKFFQWICIFNLLIHIFFWFFSFVFCSKKLPRA